MNEPRRERKVVTVVFADLVGFTARADALDPEDVEAILRPYHERLRTELERYGGTVEKFIGDAVMAVFGAPATREDDGERAVRAALAIRDWAVDEGAVAVRIAVNTGEAVVSLDARPEAGEGIVTGDVVNTTARLQTAAPENGVLVGEATWSSTKHVIEYREAPPVDAKGKAQPVPVWEATQARARFGIDVRQTSPAPLVGRERERGLLLETFARVRSERSPQLVTLVGVPGIGKSRLVYALFEALEQGTAGSDLVMWRQGRCLPYGDGVSFWALAEIVKAQAGILEDDSSDAAQEKLAEAVRAVLDESDARWAEMLLLPLIGVETETVGDRRDEAFSAWRRFIEGLAEQRALILVVEDLHWADEGLLDFVDHLIDWASDVPLLVLCTARPELLERRPGWGGGKLNALTLGLGPLQADDSARLIAGVLVQAVLPAETQQALLERAGGNPLYAEQYARLYLERGSVDDLPLPETVHGLIAARLDTLPADEKALLQDAAVMGKVFWSGALGGDGSNRDRLHSLERKEFIRRERRSSVAGEDEYAFRHVLVRDVAYGQIPRAARAAKHRAAAEWIEALGRPQDHAELLAHHYLSAFELARAAGEETSDLAQKARVALREAGDRALALNAYQPAVGFYTSALALVAADDEDRPQLLFGLGRARFLGDEEGEDVLTDAASALVAAEDREAAAEVETLLVELAWKRAQRDEAFGHLDRAVELVAELPPSPAKAFVLSTKSRYLMLAGENDEGIARGREALAMAEELGLDEIRAHALNNIGVCRYQLGDDGGLADLEQSIAIARAANSSEVLRGYTNLIACLGDSGVNEIMRVRREAMPLAERFGQRGHLRWFRGGLSWELYAVGEWDEALRVANEFILEAQESPHYLENANRLVRAVIGVARGDEAGALDDTERALAQARTAKDPQSIYPSLAVRAKVLAEIGDLAAAEEVAREIFPDLALRVPGMPLDAGATLAEIALDLGREDELRRALDEAEAQRRRPAELAVAIIDGDFDTAIELIAATGHRSLTAKLRLRAAEQLAREGRRADADAQLRPALEFYRSVGATRYVREAEMLLRESA